MLSHLYLSAFEQPRCQLGFSQSCGSSLPEDAGYLTPIPAELHDEHSRVPVTHPFGAFVDDLDRGAGRRHTWINRNNPSWSSHLAGILEPTFALHGLRLPWRRLRGKRQDVSGVPPNDPIFRSFLFVFVPARRIEGYAFNHDGLVSVP
jgi:hypothetical protein